jgi:hypothetical protein
VCSFAALIFGFLTVSSFVYRQGKILRLYSLNFSGASARSKNV